MPPDRTQSQVTHESRRVTGVFARLVVCLILVVLAACSAPDPGAPATGTTGGGTSAGAGASGVGGTSANVGGAGNPTAGSAGNAGSAGSTGASNRPGVVVDGVCYALCTTATGSATDPNWGFEDGASCVVPGTPPALGQACTTGQPLPPPQDLPPGPGVVIGSTCYPLCVATTTGTGDNPDWGYENGASCVIPGTHTAVAQMCTTGQPLPDPAALCGRTGVVVLDSGGSNLRECVALCTYLTDPALDPEGDDWDYEYGDSCVIPNSTTSQNQGCSTCQDVPAPLAKPGVVVVDGSGTPNCVPLCVVNADPALDPEGDDWAYEDNSSCVIPNTAPALTNLACTTGQPLPADSPRPGVVVSETPGVLSCVANCTFYLTATQDGANDDGLADDWAWENNASCIIPGTITARGNQTCTTLMPLPAPEPRPGVVVNSDPLMDSCLTSACVPLCAVVTTASDPAYPDWGWENNNSCVIPGTPTATVIPKAVENHGYEVPPRACTWGTTAPNFLTPPALDAARVVRNRFQTVGAVLRDPYDQPFLIRGVNNSHGWYDICGQYSAYEALDNIAAEGANAVRVGWAFESIDPVGPGSGDPEKPVIGTNPALLAEILHRIVELEMVPILALNDSTGQTDTEWPRTMAEFMTAPGYKEVLLAYEPYLLVGVANEWNGTEFLTAYNQAVTYFREQGINHTLVVTANEWGQGCDAILNDGPDILANDPLGNVLFDIHIYNYLGYGGEHGGDATIVQNCLDAIAAAQIPLLVGEFGHTHGEMPVQWQTIIARADANGQGYTPWLWYGDTEYPALNMNSSWEGPLSTWGNDLVPFGGTKASIFP